MPPAAARTAWISSFGAVSLSRKPAPPSVTARRTFSRSPKVVRISARAPGATLDSSPSAVSPSITGIWMSSSTTSTRCDRASSSASRPSAASATTSMSSAEPRIILIPARISGSSSATRTRITLVIPLERCFDFGTILTSPPSRSAPTPAPTPTPG